MSVETVVINGRFNGLPTLVMVVTFVVSSAILSLAMPK